MSTDGPGMKARAHTMFPHSVNSLGQPPKKDSLGWKKRFRSVVKTWGEKAASCTSFTKWLVFMRG